MLQLDGRRSFAGIATELGIDEEAVAQRVQALTDAGVIQVTAVSDPLQLGFARQAMLGITVEKGLEKAVAERLAEVPEIVYIVLTAGGFEILAEVVGTSDAHLLELVTSVVKPTPGVLTIHTFLYQELQKQTYTWGVR
ncbi:MAG: Lrp/AsnC family transcriptional regulator [Marmoricola sp.]|nr:Lrp/AsnC family transcriptional regulator [Marmoricola sp.]